MKAQEKGIISVIKSKTILVKQYGRWTVVDVLEHRPPSMARLRRELGEEKVEAAIATLLEHGFKQYLQSVDDELLLEISREVVYGPYYYLSIEDVYIVLRDLIRNGKQFRLTPAMVYKALADYADIRLAAAERNSESRNLALKQGRDDSKAVAGAAEAHRLMLAAYKKTVDGGSRDFGTGGGLIKPK